MNGFIPGRSNFLMVFIILKLLLINLSEGNFTSVRDSIFLKQEKSETGLKEVS